MKKTDLSKYTSTVEMTNKKLGLTIAIGFVVGVVTWLLTLLLQSYVVEPIFCRSADSFGACANGGTIAIVIALILTHTAGLFGLVRFGVFRPLLIVLAALITLIGVQSWLGSLAWYEAAAWLGLLTALAYALYAWIARMASFVVSLVVMIVVIVALRIAMAQL